jgi:hypothetical protein
MSTMSVRTSIAALVAALAGACLLGSAPARADRGVALDLGRVEITAHLLPGGRYRLPAFGIRNPGDVSTAYRMVVSQIRNGKRLGPPEDWFRFEPREFALTPGSSRPVRVWIDLPAGADPGDYETLVAAQVVTEEEGVQVGAAAASRVSFTVAPSSTLQAWWLETKRFVSDHSPWIYVAPSMLFLALALRQLRRRVAISVTRRT